MAFYTKDMQLIDGVIAEMIERSILGGWSRGQIQAAFEITLSDSGAFRNQKIENLRLDLLKK